MYNVHSARQGAPKNISETQTICSAPPPALEQMNAKRNRKKFSNKPAPSARVNDSRTLRGACRFDDICELVNYLPGWPTLPISERRIRQQSSLPQTVAKNRQNHPCQSSHLRGLSARTIQQLKNCKPTQALVILRLRLAL